MAGRHRCRWLATDESGSVRGSGASGVRPGERADLSRHCWRSTATATGAVAFGLAPVLRLAESRPGVPTAVWSSRPTLPSRSPQAVALSRAPASETQSELPRVTCTDSDKTGQPPGKRRPVSRITDGRARRQVPSVARACSRCRTARSSCAFASSTSRDSSCRSFASAIFTRFAGGAWLPHAVPWATSQTATSWS
jgi:hypothetical protein